MNAIERKARIQGKRQLTKALKLVNAVRGFNCSYLPCIDCPFNADECMMVTADNNLKAYNERQAKRKEEQK